MSTPSLHVSLECVAVQADEQQLEEHDISHVQCVFHAYRSSHLLLPSGDAAMVMEPTFPYPDGISALPLRLPDVEDESKVRTVYVADGGVAALLPINTVLQDGIHLQIREELSVQVPALTSPLNTAELSGPMATPLTQAGAQQPLREYHFPCGSPPNITDVISPNPTNADFGAAAEMMEVDAAHNNDDNNHTTYYYYLFCATSLSNSALMSTATSRTSSIASAEEAEAKWGKGSFALGLRAQWSGFLVMDDMHAPTWSAGTAVSMVMRLDPLPVCDAEAAHPIAKAEAGALTTQGMDLRCRVEMRPAMALHDPVDGATITMGSNKDSQSSTVLPQPRSILLKSVSSFSSQKQRITFHTDDDAKEGNAARSRNSSLSMTITSSTLGSSTITTSCSTSSLDEEVAALIEEVGPSTEVLAATTTTGAAVPDPPSPRSVSRYRTSSGPRFSSVVVDVDVSESRPPESEAPHILHDDDDDDGAQSLLHRRVSSLTNSGRSLPSMPPLNPQLLQQGLSGRESVTSDPPVLMGTQHPAEEVQQLPPIVVAGLSSPPASTSVVASNTLPTLIAEEVAPAVVQPPPSADATPLPVNAVVAERVDAPAHSVAVVSLDGSLESDSDPLPIQRELRFSSVEESPGSQIRSSKSSTTPVKVPTPPKGEHQEADAHKEPQKQQQQPHEHRRHSLRRRSSAAFLEASASILSHARSDGGEEYGYSYYSYSSSSSSSQHRAALVGTSDRTPPEDGSSDRTFTPSPESSCPSMHPAASSVFPNIGEQLDLCSASAEISAQMMSAIASSTPFTSTPPPHQETLTVDVDRRTSQQPSLSYTSPLLDDDEDGYDASHPRGRRRSGNNMVGTSSISQHNNNNNNKSDAERSPTTETMTATAPPTARRLSEDNTDALESFLSAPHGATTPPHTVSLPLTSQAAPLLPANSNSTSSSSYSHSDTSSPQTSSSAYVGESATMDSYSILPQSSLCLTEENVGLTAFEIQRPKAWSGVRTFVSSATIGGRHVMHSVEGCPHVARTSSSSRRRGGATPRRTVHFEELHNNVEEPPTTKTGPLRFLRGCRRSSPTEAVKKHSARTSSSEKRRSAMMHAEMEEKPKRSSSSSSQRGKAVVVEERGCLRQLPLVACCRVEPPSHPPKPTTSAATTTPSKTRNASSVSASSRSHHHHHHRHDDDDDDEESSPTRSSSTSSTEREFLQRQYSEETTMASVAAEESKGSTVALVAAHMRNLLRSGSPPFREASELHESVAAMLQQEEEPVGMAHEVSNIVAEVDVPLFADTAPATARVDAVMEADLPRQESGPACELVAAPAQACVEMLAMNSISLDAAAATIQPQRSLALSTQESEVRPAEEDEEDEREKEMPQEEPQHDHEEEKEGQQQLQHDHEEEKEGQQQPQHDHEEEKEGQQHVNEDDGVGSTTTPARAAVESSITSVVVLRHTMTDKAVLRCVWPRTRHARYFSPALPRLFADEVELPRLHAWEAEPPEEVLPPATPLTKMFSATSVRRGFVFAEVEGLERIAQILASQMPSRSRDDDDDDDAQLRLALYSADRELLATSSTLHLPIASSSLSSSSSRIHRWSDILCLPPSDLDALPASMFVELQRRVLRLITHAPPPPMPPTTSSSSLEVPKQDDDDGVVLTATTNTGEEVMSVVPQLSPISTAVLADDLSPPPRPLPNAASRSSSTHTHGDVELRTPAVVASHLSSSSFSSYHSHATTTTPAPHAHDHDDAPPAPVVAPPPPPDVREESSVWGSTNSSVAQAQEAAAEVVADDDHENENGDDDGEWEEFTDDDAPVPITTPQLPSAQDVQIPSRDVAADVAEVVVGDVVVAPSDVVVVSVQRALPSASPPPPPVAEHFDALQHTELHHVEAVWVSLATSAIIPADDLRHDAPTPTTKSVALTATHASSSSSSTSLRAGEYLANLMYALGSCSSIYTPAAEQLRPICDAIRTRAEATLRAPTQSSSSSSCVLHPRTLTTSPVTMLVESLPRHQHTCNAPPTTSLVGVRGDHLTTAANLSSAYSVVVRASTVLVDVLPSVAPHTPQPQVSLHISGGRDGILGSSTTHNNNNNNNNNECGSPVISLRCNVQTLLTVDAPSILITATSSIAEEIFVAHAHVNVFDVMEKLGHTHVRVHRGEKWLPLHASPPHNNNNDDDGGGGGGGASLRRCRVGWVHVDYECRPVEILKEHLSCLRGESTTTQRDDDDDDDELIDVSVMEATGLALPTNANVLSGMVNAYCEMNVVRRPCNPIHNNNNDDDDDDESSIKCAPAITTTALNCGGEPRWGHTFRAYMNNIHQLCVRVAHRECADVHPSSTSTPLGCVVVGPYQIQRIMRSLRAQNVGHVADDASSPPPHVVLWMPIFLRAATLTRCGPQRWREPPAHINGALLLIFSFANTNAHHRHHYDVRRFMMREWSCLSTAHVGCYGSRTTIHGSQPLLPSSTQHDEHDDDDVAWLRLSEMRVVWPWLLHVGSSSLRLHLTTPSGTSDYSLRTQKQDDDDDDDDVDGATFVVMEDVLIPATPVMEWSVYRRSRLMHDDDDDDDELLGCGRWAVRDASSRARLARMPPVEATVVVEMMPVELNASQHLESGYLTHHLTTFPSIANMMKDAHTSSSWRWPGVGTAAIMELRVLDYVGIDASGAPHADDVGVLVSEAPQSHRGNVAEQWLEGLGGADVPRTDARNILPCHHRRHHKSDDDDGASVLRLEWPARPFAWCSRPPPTLRLYIVELQQQQQKSARDDDDDAPRLPAHGLALLPHLKAFRNNVGRCWLPLLQPREDGAECVGFIKMSYRHNLVKHNTHDDDDDDDDDDVVLPDYLVEVSLGPLQCRQSLVDAAQILVGIDAYVVRVDARDGGSVVLPCAGRGCRMLRMQLTSSDAPSPLAYARLRVAQAADDDDVVVMSRSDGVVVGDVRVRWRRVEANAPTTSPACAHVASWCTAPQPHTQQIIAASEAQRLRDTATATTTTTWENHDDVAHLPRAQTYLRLMHVKWANGVGGVASSLRDVVGNIATRVVVRCRQRPDNTTTTTTTTTTTSSSRQDDDDDDRHESVDLTELCGIGAIDATTSASVSWPDAQPLILALPRRGVDVELEACVYVSDATSTSPDVCVLRGVADYHGGLCRPMLMRVALHPHETWSAHIGRGVACGDVEMMVEEIHSLVPTTTTTTTNMMKEVDEVSQTKTSTDGLSADASYLAEESGGEASMSSAMMLMEVRIVALELVGVHAEKQWEVGTQVVVKVRDASVAGRQPVVLRAQRCTSAQGGLCWVGDVCQPAGSIMTVEVRVGGGMHVLRTTANQGSGVFSHSSASTATSIHHHQQQQQQLHVPQLVYGGTSALHGEGSITVPQNLRHHPDANTCVMREIIMDALGTCVLGNMCVELRAVASTETSYAATELFFHRVAHVRLRDCVGLIRGDVQQLHQDVLAYQRLQHRCLMQHTHKGRVGRALRRRLAEARRCVEQSTSTYTQQPQQHTLWLEVGTNNENVLMNVRRSANFGIPTAATLLHRRGERVAAPLRFTADVCWPTTTRDASLRLQLVSGNAHDDDEDDDVDASSTIIADGVMDLRPPPAVFRRPQRRRRWHTLPTLVGGGEISVMAEVAWSTAVRRGGLRAHFLFLRPSPTCASPRYPCVRLTYHFDADGSEVAQYLPLHNNNNNNNDDVYDAGNGVWCLASTLLPRVGCIGGRVVRAELLDLIPSSGERAEAEVFLGQHAWTSADEEALQHAQTSPDAHRTWWLRFVRDDVRGTTEYYELLCCVSANVGEEAPQHDDAPTSWSTCCSLEIISMDARLTTSKVAVDGWTNNVSVACTTQLQPTTSTTSTTTTTSPVRWRVCAARVLASTAASDVLQTNEGVCYTTAISFAPRQTQPHVCAMMLRLDHVLVDAHHLRFVFFSAELTQTFVAFASVRQLVANMAHEGTTPLHLYTCIHDEDDAVGIDEGATCVGEVFVRWRMHPPQLVPMAEAVRSTEETLAEERRVWGSDDVLDDLFSTTETAVVEDEAVRNMEQTQAWMDQLDEVARQCAEELLATWSWQVMRVEVEGLHLPRIHAPEMMAARPPLQRAVAMRDDVDAATTHDAPRRILAQLAYPVVAENNNNNNHDDQDHDDVLQRVGVCSTTASISAAAAFGATFSPLPWVLPLRELQQQLSRTHAHLSLWEVLPHTQGPHTALLLATLPLRAVLAELWCISTTAMRENGVVATATSPMAPPPRPSTLTTEWMSTDDANTMHSTRVRLTFASPWSRMAADKAISTPQEADEMMHLIAAKEPRTLVAELRDIRVNLSANTAKTNAQQRYGLIVLVPEAHMRHTTTLHECANMDDDATTTTTSSSLLQVHLQPRTPLLSWRTTPQAGATYAAHVYLVELHAHVSDGSFARTDVVRLCGQQRISLEQLSLTTSATVQEIAMDLLRGEGRLTMHLSLASVSGTARSSAAMLREAAMRQRHPELEMLFAAQHHQHDCAGAPAFALLGSSLVFGHAVAAGAVVCGAPQPTCVGGHMKDLHACSGISEMHWPHTTTRRATATTAPSSLVVPPLPRNMAEWVVEEVLDARGASPAVLLRGRTGHVVVPFITHDGSTAMLIEGGLQHGMKADVIPAQQQQQHQQHACITPALPCLYFPRRRHLVQLMWPRGSTHDASMAYHGHTATLVGGAVWMLGGFASALANLPAASSLIERHVPTRPTQPRNDDDGGRRGLVQKRRDEIQRMKMRTHTGHRRVVRRSRTPANPNRLRHTAASAPVAAHAAANDDGDDVLDAAPPSPSTPLTMAFSTDVRCALIDTTTAEVSPCVRVPPLPHNTSHTPGAAGAHTQRGCWIALDAPPAVAMHVAMRIGSVVLLHGGLTESATSSASINISDDLVAFDTLRLRWWRWERPTTQPWPVARFGHATVALPATTDDDEDDCCSAFLIFGGASTMAEVVPLADMLWVLKCAPDDATRMKEAPPLRPSWTCVRVSACSPLRSRVMANLLVYRHAPHTTAAVADEERANVSDFGRCLLLVCGGVDERSSWETNAKSQQQQHDDDDDDDVATSIHAADAYTNCVERWLGAPRLGSVLLECIVAPEGGSGQTTAALVVPS